MSEPVSSPDNIPFELAPTYELEGIASGVLGDAADAAIFETFVIPNYLSSFGELVVSLLDEVENARVAHVLARTGYPDRDIAQRLPGARIQGFDPSPYAVELANVKAASALDVVAEYTHVSELPSMLPEGIFSHALSIHPIVSRTQRVALYDEVLRLLRPGGQAVFALPVRGSFIEIYDLLREFGLKTEAADLENQIARAVELRPTIETFGSELENAGFVDTEVELNATKLTFRNARDFFESPSTRLVILPDVKADLAAAGESKALDYLRDAIAKYWSDTDFELSINIACATARKS